MMKYGWKLLVLIVLAALVFVWLIRAPILSSYLTKKMGVNVSLRWIGLWPRHTNIHFFSIKNPPGFKGDAFKADQITCNYQLGRLFSDPSIIEEIEIKDCVLQIDLIDPMGSANNWTAIGKMIPQQKKRSHVIIRKLVLTNFNVVIHGKNLFIKPKQTYFDRLEFDDIDSEEGFPTARLIQMIFQSSGIQDYIKDFLNPGGNLQRYLSPLKVFGT